MFRNTFVRLLLLAAAVMVVIPTVLGQTAYEPTYESLATHPVPDWYKDAKLGIFIHWGLYSVPGWAPLTGELAEVLAENATADGQPGWQYWFAHNPYAEWYANSMKVEGSDTQQHHNATYGPDFVYADFVPEFQAAVQAWQPAEWAALFADLNARYVVLTTKHHDGFLLWPSDNPNPFNEGWQSERDLVGELTKAVRAAGMEMGLYYSGGIDWTFRDITITDFNTLIAAIPQDQEYAQYASTHWRELIEKYQPKILWNDLGFPPEAGLYELFAEYYNQIPDGLINNRFALGATRDQFHYDFETIEFGLGEISDIQWESTRGLGYSFGYNQLDSAENVIPPDQLVDDFVDTVAKGGNLLLNIGPRADGSIPQVYLDTLLPFGDWLDVNGEAIFATRPHSTNEATTADGLRVRFTRTADALYAILLDAPTGDSVTIPGLAVSDDAVISILGLEGDLTFANSADGLVITLPDLSKLSEFALSIRITPAPGM